jgi:transcriptional regulator with XRE-family HTH domain
MGELKDMMDLRESRDKAKKTQAMLSVATGLDQGYLSRVESGERSLSPATAKKLAAALNNTNAATLVFSNRSAMLQRAVDRGDVAGAIEAAKSAYKTAEANGWTDDDDGDEALSEFLDAATKFVESAASGTYEDGETYGVIDGAGRAPFV